jgi:hypothetical protein
MRRMGDFGLWASATFGPLAAIPAAIAAIGSTAAGTGAAAAAGTAAASVGTAAATTATTLGAAGLADAAGAGVAAGAAGAATGAAAAGVAGAAGATAGSSLLGSAAAFAGKTLLTTAITGLAGKALAGRMETMRGYRIPWWTHWAQLAEMYLPRRYRWFVTPNQYNRGSPLNQSIVDETGLLRRAPWRLACSPA